MSKLANNVYFIRTRTRSVRRIMFIKIPLSIIFPLPPPIFSYYQNDRTRFFCILLLRLHAFFSKVWFRLFFDIKQNLRAKNNNNCCTKSNRSESQDNNSSIESRSSRTCFTLHNEYYVIMVKCTISPTILFYITKQK